MLTRAFTVRKLSNCIRRCMSSSVRVRFAPSPTGHLHLGGLRTAIYNYLFAVSKNGQMILRIEDTDQSRKVEGAAESLVENLEWAGIKIHEGPYQGGARGPYVQSERCSIYQNMVQKLVDNGSAYKCFCTDRRLDLLKKDALRSRQIPKYDNKCRHLSKAEAQENTLKGNAYCIRFKLSSNCSSFEDLIYGTIAYDITLNEGDPVILKSDGFPTYHLANVVDDHLMEITHVLRGVEWQISTTKHLLLYRAFGWEPPKFGHLPLIVNSDGSKLSKRQGDIRVQEYKKNGILPIALINYITLAGGGFARVPNKGQQHYNMKELAERFDINLINSNSSRLNPDLLNECNRLAIMEHIKNDDTLKKLVVEVQELIELNFKGKNLQSSPDYVESVLKWSSGRITSITDLMSPPLAFLWVLPNEKPALDSSDRQFIKNLKSKLHYENETKFERSDMKRMLKEFCSENNANFSTSMKLIRNILSGLDAGPGVGEMMEILGKDVTIQRLNSAL